MIPPVSENRISTLVKIHNGKQIPVKMIKIKLGDGTRTKPLVIDKKEQGNPK